MFNQIKHDVDLTLKLNFQTFQLDSLVAKTFESLEDWIFCAFAKGRRRSLQIFQKNDAWDAFHDKWDPKTS